MRPLDDRCEEAFVRGVSEFYLEDLERRGAAQTEENRAVVADALKNRKLALCGLCCARSSAVRMFAPVARPAAQGMRVVFYGLCFECECRLDIDVLVWERIEVGEPFGHAVELASAGLTSEELDELLLQQFPPETREFFGDRIIHPERYGLDWCSRCGTRPMAVFGFHNSGIPEAVGMYRVSLYALCRECHAETQTRLESQRRLLLPPRSRTRTA